MSPPIATDRRANLVGTAWMIGAMAGFAVEDSLLKAASAVLPIGQVLVLFGLVGALIFNLLARRNGDILWTRDVLAPAMRWRFVFEFGGRLFYILALSLIPLSAATVILQATPLVVVGAAAILFGEKVGWRRWSAIGVGLIGVVIIVQPGSNDFSPLTLLAIIGMLGFAGRDLASRAAPASLGTSVLGFYGFLTIAMAGAAVSLWEGHPFLTPTLQANAIMLVAAGTGVVAYTCLMKAMRIGEVAAVTPFRYTRLLFGIGLGLVLFDERLSLAMLIGSGLIVLSGLFILWRSAPQ